MKITVLLFTLCTISVLGFAQRADTSKSQQQVFVEHMPEFPGGQEGMIKYISDNIKYPKADRDKGIEGIVYLTFNVTSLGDIDSIKVLRSPGGTLAAEAVRVIKQMPKWKPATQNGQGVTVKFTLPVNFKLASRKEIRRERRSKQ